jgi:hypothetical protein
MLVTLGDLHDGGDLGVASGSDLDEGFDVAAWRNLAGGCWSYLPLATKRCGP